MTVEFQLLGDVEVRVDGRQLDIGHSRQRCVLVAMLVDVNHPVPLEQLVERVWSDRPPHAARNTLASYVSRLRNLFVDVHGVGISRGPGGYVFSADPMSVDLHRFRNLASQAAATADPYQATVLFDRALDAFGGEPFASLDTWWINDVRGALLGERLSVVLDRNDVALRAGQHAGLLLELTEMQAARPLDERLAGQLMLAQYYGGRQADALDTYRKIRQRIVEELGLEPGLTLREVHRQILSGETETSEVGATREISDTCERVASSGAGRPDRSDVSGPLVSVRHDSSHQVRRVTTFVGHRSELANVADALRQGPLVMLTGVGGVGKTRLALEVARREQEAYGDDVWICELAPLDHAEAVVHTVAAALGLRQQQGLDTEQSVIEYLRAREVLLVVDNCEHVLEAATRLIGQIVHSCPRVSVLATSRQPLDIEGERIVVVAPLPVEDATLLFTDRARAGRPDFDLDQQPAGAVAEICRRVDCLPLGVELAAARMRFMSSRDVVRRLDDLHLLRGGVRGALPRQQSLIATIDWSYRLLTELEQALFARLSVFAGSFDLEAAHGVCGVEGAGEDDTLDLLAGLVDKSMVVVRSATDRTRYGVLATLRTFGRECLQERGIEKHLALRHAVYYTELAERAGAAIQGPHEREWIERMLPDYDNLRIAFECAMAGGDVDLAMRLVASSSELVGVRVGYEVAGWAGRVVAVASPDHPLYAATVGVAARGAFNCGEADRALSLAALADGRAPGRGAARVAYPADVLADAALFGGAAARALEYWKVEAARARGDVDPIRQVQAVSALAVSHAVLGNPDAALPDAREAVAVADGTGNPTARSMAYFALGYLLKKSEPARALVLFDDAARLAGEVQNFWWFGIALMEAAATRAVHGDPATAARMFIEVLDHWERAGEWAEQWVSIRYITRLLATLGADDDALFLHCAVVRAGKRAPLRAEQLRVLIDRVGADHFDADCASAADGPGAVARARGVLRRYDESVAETPKPRV